MNVMLKYKFLFVLILSAIGFSSFVDKDDDGISKLKKCLERYIELEQFSMDIEYSIFKNSQNFSTPDEIKKGVMIKMGDMVYQEEMGNVVISNGQYLLEIDNRSKVLLVRDLPKNHVSSSNFNLDSMVNYIEKVKKIENGYEYWLSTGKADKIAVLFDTNGLIKTFRSFYTTQMDNGSGFIQVVSQLRYLNFTVNPIITNQTFSIEKYCVIKNGEIYPKGKYKNYNVLNNLK